MLQSSHLCKPSPVAAVNTGEGGAIDRVAGIDCDDTVVSLNTLKGPAAVLEDSSIASSDESMTMDSISDLEVENASILACSCDCGAKGKPITQG